MLVTGSLLAQTPAPRFPQLKLEETKGEQKALADQALADFAARSNPKTLNKRGLETLVTITFADIGVTLKLEQVDFPKWIDQVLDIALVRPIIPQSGEVPTPVDPVEESSESKHETTRPH